MILGKRPLFLLKTLRNAIIICGKIAKLYIQKQVIYIYIYIYIYLFMS